MHVSIACLTDAGRVRKGNEDAFIVTDLTQAESIGSPGELTGAPVGAGRLLLAVADGMGGAQAGEVASRMAVKGVARQFITASEQRPVSSCLIEGLRAANRDIRMAAQANQNYQGMGTTMTVAVIQQGHAVIGQVGDSRGYLIRDGQIQQITKDQSLVQTMIDAGRITKESAAHFPYRNIILHALGAEDEIEPAISSITLASGDYLLLCSDGLSNKVGDAEMLNIVLGAESLDAACEKLTVLANERGGEDNITLIVARFGGAKEMPS